MDLHPSVFAGGSTIQLHMNPCTSISCNSKDQQHFHCSFCPSHKNIFSSAKLVQMHFQVKHVDDGISFAGYKMLHCKSVCEIHGPCKGSQKIEGWHWHCFHCHNAFKRKDYALKHYTAHACQPSKKETSPVSPIAQHDISTLLEQYFNDHYEKKDDDLDQSLNEAQELFDKASTLNNIVIPQVTLKGLLAEIECLKNENQTLLSGKLTVEKENLKLKEDLLIHVKKIEILESKLKVVSCKDTKLLSDCQDVSQDVIEPLSSEKLFHEDIDKIYLTEQMESDSYFHNPKSKNFVIEFDSEIIPNRQKDNMECQEKNFECLDECSSKIENKIGKRTKYFVKKGFNNNDGCYQKKLKQNPG